MTWFKTGNLRFSSLSWLRSTCLWWWYNITISRKKSHWCSISLLPNITKMRQTNRLWVLGGGENTVIWHEDVCALWLAIHDNVNSFYKEWKSLSPLLTTNNLSVFDETKLIVEIQSLELRMWLRLTNALVSKANQRAYYSRTGKKTKRWREQRFPIYLLSLFVITSFRFMYVHLRSVFMGSLTLVYDMIVSRGFCLLILKDPRSHNHNTVQEKLLYTAIPPSTGVIQYFLLFLEYAYICCLL